MTGDYIFAIQPDQGIIWGDGVNAEMSEDGLTMLLTGARGNTCRIDYDYSIKPFGIEVNVWESALTKFGPE